MLSLQLLFHIRYQRIPVGVNRVLGLEKVVAFFLAGFFQFADGFLGFEFFRQ